MLNNYTNLFIKLKENTILKDYHTKFVVSYSTNERSSYIKNDALQKHFLKLYMYL